MPSLAARRAAQPARVLLVTGSLPPMACGVGEYTSALAGALAQSGSAEVGVLTSSEAARDREGRFEVFPVVRRWNWADLSEAKAVLRGFRPDLVHFQFPTQGHRGDLAWELPPLVRLLGFPVVQTWHETSAARWGGWIPHMGDSLIAKIRTAVPQLVLSLVPGEIIVVRPDFERSMPRWYAVLPLRDRFRLIENASMIPRADSSEADRAAVKARYAAGGRALLVFFGFFSEQKGIDDLLDILDPARHHLVMIGSPNEEDPYQRELLRRLRQPPLAAAVTLTGFLPPLEVAQVMAAADAVVLPYRRGAGGWNTTLRAALLQGSFVLTTSVEGTGFDPEKNAYFARPGDVDDLRRGLEANLGRRIQGPARTVTARTWPEIAAQHLDVYARVLGAPVA